MAGRNGLRVRGDMDNGWEGDGRGYMEAKVKKLEQQFREDSDGRRQVSSLFYGVAIQVDGYTNPSADELKILMSKHGGKYHMYYSSSKTTHVIASNLPHAKRKELRPNQKVVKPEWIVDSLKCKELLPIDDYLVVPLDNGLQNRITSLLGKRKSTDFTASCNSEANAENSSAVTTNLHQNDNPEKSFAPGNNTSKASSRTVCPTTDSNFLSEFYSHSRLHFLSTWKMELTEYVRHLQTEESLLQLPLSGYQKLLEISKTEGTSAVQHGRTVLHVDMDCFFVSVGLLSRPEFKGLPVAVTHSSGSAHTRERPGADFEFEKQYYENKYHIKKPLTDQPEDAVSDEATVNQQKRSSTYGSSSEIASCSYEARATGVKNGMFFGKAKQLCPDLRVIPYDFEAYRQASDQIYSTLATYTRHIEAVSCDEALVDITQLVEKTGLSPQRIAACIRQSVKEATGCNASAGVGPNIAIARMATRRAKPDGEFAVTAEEAKTFMLGITVRDLPGVGRSTASRLQEMGLPTCRELQKFPIEKLKKEFGAKTGQKLHDMSCGVDDREVKRDKERKSVSAEVNYGIRLTDEDEAKKFLENLANEVTNRLKAATMRGRRVTLKLMVKRPEAPSEPAKYGGHGVCDSLSKSVQITLQNSKGTAYEDDAVAINEAAWSMLMALKVNIQDLRGIGIQVTQLQPLDAGESSSAAFLKKFMVKKSEKKEENEGEAHQHLPATVEDKVKNVSAVSSLPPDEQAKAVDVLNCSFLDALPPELQKEVRENFEQQKQALEKNFQENESSTLAAQRLANTPGFEPVGKTTASNESNDVLRGSGRPSAGSSTSSVTGGHKVTRGKGKGSVAAKPKTQKSQTSKSGRRTPTTGTSPNKLITDMFPVTYSPSKSGSAKSSPLRKSPALKVAAQNNSAAEIALAKVKRNLVSIEEEPVIQIEDSDEEPVAADDVHKPTSEVRPADDVEDVPSLGGAITIRELRQAMIEWTEAYENGPLECDVDDFISFLVRTAVDIRNLEKVNLVMRSFRRTLASLRTKGRVSSEGCSGWSDVYNGVCAKVQVAVRKAYNGGELNLLPL